MAYLGFIVQSIMVLMISSNLVLADEARTLKRLKRTVKALSSRVTSLETSQKQPDAEWQKKFDALMSRVASLEASQADTIKIVSSQGEAGNATCAKICAGTTKRGSTTWTTPRTSRGSSSNVIYTNVDMTECGFATVPTITTALEGTEDHLDATGTSSVYSAKKDGFRIFVVDYDGPGGLANERNWNVEWVAVGYTC